MEDQRLSWVFNHQSEIKHETYRCLQDAIRDDDVKNAGIGKVLPTSFTGGPRCKDQWFQDGLCRVEKCTSPALFITMTCNTKWKEIQDALLPGQVAADRPDLVAHEDDGTEAPNC